MLTPQLHGILTCRIASLFHRSIYIHTQLRKKNVGRINSSSEIYYSAEIGCGLKINNGIGTIIGARSKIGSNCTLHQNVTLGDKNSGRPTIGNDCIIYVGALILGDIKIGNNCIVGANAVVMNDFSDNSIIVGTPTRKIN